MKQLLSFIKKEFYHISRDPRTMLILFGIPIAQLLIFGTVIKSEINDIHIAIYDQSKDKTTQQITNKILSSGYFILDENLTNLDEIDNGCPERRWYYNRFEDNNEEFAVWVEGWFGPLWARIAKRVEWN